MKLKIKLEFLAFCFVILSFVHGNDQNMLKVEGEGDETDSINDIIKKMSGGKFKNIDIDDSELSGDIDDTDDEESGSGSGDEITPTKKGATTGKKGEISSTIVDITLVSSTSKTSTMENCVECSDSVDPDGNGNNVGNKDKHMKKGKSGVNFTVGIIIGVVVGAILAILIIVFLVYRLRKKDEGSYSLDEQSSTAFIRSEADKGKGKEYYA